MADRFWVGDSGDWEDTAHWAQVSNGPGGFSVPDNTTTVYFDRYSFSTNNEIVTVNNEASVLNLVFSSSCDIFNLNIIDKLNCSSEFHIHTSKPITNGRVVLEAGAKFYGTGIISELLCKPGSYIYKTNHIGSLILDTEGSLGTSHFYFEDFSQTHVEQFNILNSSSTSKAQIETISGSNYFIIASTTDGIISIQNTRIKGCVVIGDSTFQALIGDGCVNVTPVLNLGWTWYDKPILDTVVPNIVTDDAIRALGEITYTGSSIQPFLEVDEASVSGTESGTPPYSEPKNLFIVGKHYKVENIDSTGVVEIEFSFVDGTSVILYGYTLSSSRLYDNYPSSWKLYAKNTSDPDWVVLDERTGIVSYDNRCSLTGNDRGYDLYKIVFSEFYNLKDFVINKMRCYNVDSFITVKKRGFCYRIGAIGPPPTIANSKVFEDGYFEEGNYDLLMTGLLRTRYYRIRAYAINDGGNVNGIGYGDTIIVQTDEIFIPNVSIIL